MANHASCPRNKNLAFVFYNASFIELKQGSGLVAFQRNNVNIAKPNPTDIQSVADDVAVNTKYLSEKLNVSRKNIQAGYGVLLFKININDTLIHH
ncbi:MAG: hypothetical protein IKP37_11295 [Paludibacteraceae bacterium]|nr:hypothetical protein [Paludibacteraceae bacterium]